jgi:flagellin-like protein
MKGISAVIATILLLLIVVAIVGFTFGFFQSMFQTSADTTKAQVDQVNKALSHSVSVEAVPTLTSAVIRNTGTQLVPVAELTGYVGNTPLVGIGGCATGVPVGGTCTVTWTSPNCAAGSTLRIISLAGETSKVC